MDICGEKKPQDGLGRQGGTQWEGKINEDTKCQKNKKKKERGSRIGCTTGTETSGRKKVKYKGEKDEILRGKSDGRGTRK